MFDRSKDPLKEYLATRVMCPSAASGESRKDPKVFVVWAFLNRYYELLHHIWTFSIGFAVSCVALYPFTDWTHYTAQPIVTLFMGLVVAVAELRTALLLSTVLAVAKVEWSRLHRT